MTKRILFLIIALQLLISSTAAAIACNDGGIVDIPVDCDYDYPIKPGTPEWIEIGDHHKRLELLQVPEHILQCMSTEKLTTLCLKSPFVFTTIFAYDNTAAGVNQVFTTLNAYTELAKREDATNYLCDEYILMFQRLEDIVLKYPHLINNPNLTAEEELIISTIGRSINQIFVLESLLGYSKYHNMSKDKLKKILKNLWFGYNEKIRYTDKYGFFSADFYSNFFARANVIIKIDPTLSEIFEGEENKYILFDGRPTNEDIVNKMDSLTIELIK